MKVEQCQNDTKEFCLLEPGDVFYILRVPDGTPVYFMKIEKEAVEPVFNYNAVNLSIGSLTEFSNHDLVTKYNCILVADDE